MATITRAQPSNLRLQFYAAGVVVALALVSLVFFDADQRVLAVPMYLILATATLLVAFLWQRDGGPPYFDIGVLCVLVTTLYLAYPLFAFLVSGMVWTELSDNRFTANQTTPAEFARVGWWGAVYLVSLAITYAAVRKEPAVKSNVPLEEPSGTSIRVMASIFLCCFVYMQAVQIVFGIDLNPTYGASGATSATIISLPLSIQQITNKIFGVAIVFEFALILLLVRRGDEIIWRVVLYAWAAVIMMTVIWVFGARSSIVFFVLAWLLAHQRLREPLKPLTLLVVGVVVVGASLIYGVARHVGGEGDFVGSVFSASSEFHAMYGTAYDFLTMRDSGMLNDVPWQIYLADFLRPIPQQLLPFDKLDQGDWYLELVGLKGYGMGFMFGVISEGAVGFGLPEMIVHGIAAGGIFGLLHNWYARNATKFWPTVFYLWLAVWSYYTYRASTFYLLGHVLTIFIPAYLIARVFSGEYRDIMEPFRNRAGRNAGAKRRGMPRNI